MKLTEKQRAVRDFIAEQLHRSRSCPSHREIAAHFGFASPFAASCHVAALVAKGALVREAGKARSLRPASVWPHRRTADIPIYGGIPAGPPAERQQEATGCVTVDLDELQLKSTARTFALRVQGDSMTGCGILDGDLVLLEHGGEPRHGQVVAALIDGESTLKTFVVKGRKAFLRAENPKYPDLIPAEELMVQGVFRALIRKAK
jgi:repressor LexA